MTLQVRRALTAQPVSPAQARAIVRRTLGLWDGDGVRVAELLTSELVTNAVRHAATKIVLRVALEANTVRVEVSDLDTAMPALREAPDIGGYGLRIVDRLAARWGVVVIPDGGKTVWFELDLAGREADRREAIR